MLGIYVAHSLVSSQVRAGAYSRLKPCGEPLITNHTSLPPFLQTRRQQFVQTMAILAPNQDVGFVCGAGYTSASLLVSGYLVSYPKLGGGLSWMQWIAFMKYSFQSLALNEFKVRQCTLTLTLMLDADRSVLMTPPLLLKHNVSVPPDALRDPPHPLSPAPWT